MKKLKSMFALVLCVVFMGSMLGNQLPIFAEGPQELFYATQIKDAFVNSGSIGTAWGQGVLGSLQIDNGWKPQYKVGDSAFTDMIYGLKEGSNCYLFPNNDSSGAQMMFNWVAGSGNYAAKMIAGDGEMALTFVAPEEGQYALLPDSGDIKSMDWTDPAIWLFTTGSTLGIYKNDTLVWPENGSVYTASKDKETLDLPALTFSLAKGDVVRLAVTGTASTLPAMRRLPDPVPEYSYSTKIKDTFVNSESIGTAWGQGVLGSVQFNNGWRPQYKQGDVAFTDMIYGLKEGSNCYIFPNNDSSGAQMMFNWVAGSGNYAAKLIAGDGAMALTFVAPAEGKYALLPDSGEIKSMDWTDPAVWLFTTGSTFGIYKNDTLVWPENGSVYTASQDKETFNLPSLVFDLAKDDVIRLAVTGTVSTLPVMRYVQSSVNYEGATFNGEEGESLHGTMTAVSSTGLDIGYTVKTQPAHGTLTFNQDGTFLYTPEAGFSGDDSFIITASDGTLTADATATLHIHSSPTLTYEGISVTAQAGKSTSGTMAAVSSAELAISYTVTTPPAHGTVSFNEDGTFTYSAQEGYSGPDSFTITATDGKRNAQATASITVKNNVYFYATDINRAVINGATVATSWSPPLGSFSYGGYNWRAQYRQKDETAFYDMVYGIKENNAYSYLFSTNSPTSARMLINWVGPNHNFAIQLQPESGDWFAVTFVAPQSGVYKLVEDAGDISSVDGDTDAKFWFRDAGAKLAIYKNDTIIWPTNGQPYVSATAGETVDFPDLKVELSKGDQLRIASPSVMSMLPAVQLDESIAVAPNYPAKTFLVKQNKTFTGTFAATDEGGSALSYTIKTQPAHGTVTFNQDGTFTYVPNQDFTGNDTFTVTASNGVLSTDGTATMQVDAVRKPEARDYHFYAKTNTTTSYALPVLDAYQQQLTYVITKQPSSGEASIGNDGKLTFASSSKVGSFTIAYQAKDTDNLLSDEKTITIDVASVMYDSLAGYVDAITDADARASGDMVPFDSLLPWQFQFRYTFMDLSEMPSFGKYGVAYACRRLTSGDGSKVYMAGGLNEPFMAINVPGTGKQTLYINAGNEPSGVNARGAMTFIAPETKLYSFHGVLGDSLAYLYGSSLTENVAPIKLWVEKNGVKIWPANEEYITLSAQNPQIELPAITTSMKKGDTIRFMVQGDDKNTGNNSVAIHPVALELGAYQASLDLNPEKEEGTAGSDNAGPDDNGNPITGVALPWLAMGMTGTAGLIVLKALKRRKANA